MIKNLLNISSGLLGFILVLVFLNDRISHRQAVVISLFVWMLIWWTNQAVHYAVTALLPLIILPIFDIVPLKEASAQYSNPVIYLFFGGFLLALSVEKWGVHKRLALWLLTLFNRNLSSVFLAVMLATYFLSMWMSNTATAIMMIPIGTALLSILVNSASIEPPLHERMYLSIAFSANIGGIATLVGTPPNLVFSGFYTEKFQTPVTFFEWFTVGFPLSLIFLIIVYLLMKPKESMAFSPEVRKLIKEEYERLPAMNSAQRRVLIIFGTVVALWFAAPFLKLTYINDTSVALSGGLVLFLVGTGWRDRQKLLEWNDTRELSWGILLLFGAGLTMASMFDKTGISDEMSRFFSQSFHSDLVLVVFLVAFTIFATECMSNVALTGLMMPVAASLAQGDQRVFFFTGMAVAMASSCAFMLPIATPPNAVVFGTGQIRMNEMIKKGFILNIVSILLFSLVLGYALKQNP
ncbi:MAG: DASS family sodium-coupled anion symporter [Thermaurantimonas sp.]